MDIQVVNSRSNLETLIIDGKYIHSKYDPLTEAKRIIENNYKRSYTHIFFGYGLGYLVDELLKIRDEERVIIYEPLLNKGLEINKNHVQVPNVIFVNNLEDLEVEIINTNNRRLINVINLQYYNQIFSEKSLDFNSIINGAIVSAYVNTETIIDYAEKWQKNLLSNSLNITKDNNLDILRNLKLVCKAPVVIAAGGPSLGKQIENLKKYRYKVILVAAGSTINSLLFHGIEPDFVVSVDGGEPNYLHFKNLKLNKSRLIYSLYNHPGIRESFSKNAYIFTDSAHISEKETGFGKIVEEFSRIDGGGSVAHFSLDIAATIFNTAPIALIGQDLSITNNMTHAEGNVFQSKVDDTNQKDYIQTEGYYGDVVTTTYPLLSMKINLESLVKKYSEDIEIFNCTEGGALIKGIPNKSFAEFLNTYALEEVELEEIFLNIEEEENKLLTKVKLLEIFSNDKAQLREVLKVIKRGLNILDEVRIKKVFSDKNLKKLNDIDDYILKNAIRSSTYSVMLQVIERMNKEFIPKRNETSMEEFDRIYKQTLFLYEETKIVIEKIINHLNNIMEQGEI